MRIYRFWARAEAKGFDKDNAEIFRSATGYSDVSLEEALRMAEMRAQKIVDFCRNPHGEVEAPYYGSDRPIREEIMKEFAADDGKYAVITRNSYGCLVLNTTDVFFADVDKPTGTSMFAALVGLFGKTKLSFEQELVGKITELVRRDPRLGLRLYRTLMGYRIVMTNRTLAATESTSFDLLRGLGADRLYVSLCSTQDCYRARLTPKPWRCGAKRPLIRFPFQSSEAESAYRAWEQRYESVAQKFATCVLVGEFGSTDLHPRVAAVLKLHDHFTLNEDLPLA